LPEEGPEYEAKIPATVAGVILFFLLSQSMAWDPGREESFELVEVGADGGAQAIDLSPEALRPGRRVRCHCRTVLILSY
jgi:hypothetical protein